MSDETLPVRSFPRICVRALAVEVLSGPDKGKRVETPKSSLSIGKAEANDLVLSDRSVSGFHAELSRSDAGIVLRDLGSKNGTIMGDVRVERGVIKPGASVQLGLTTIRVLDGKEEAVEIHDKDELSNMRGKTPSMLRLMAQVDRLARTTVPVLITGESGTGKELVARALHENSERSSGPFVVVDCGALSPQLAASELFGHERGAFTGADRQHQGAFERANGGTLFLDEIGELPMDMQPQLLGALERRRFSRVGGRSELSVDVRVVCATNRDLRGEVNSGGFRMDLFYRIAVVTLLLPPLRERIDDIPLLVQHFLHELGHEEPMSAILTDDVFQQLTRHSWPGNVRELRNWVEAMVAMGEPLDPTTSAVYGDDSSPSSSGSDVVSHALGHPYQVARDMVLRNFEHRYLSDLLERSENNVSRASREARMDRSYLIKLLQRHGLR